MMRVAVLSVAVMLSACGTEPAVTSSNVSAVSETLAPIPTTTPSSTPAVAKSLLNLAPGAVALVDTTSGSSRELPFGMAKDAVLAAVTLALGDPAERGVNRKCGEGAMDFAKFKGGPVLWFQEGKLAGWFLDDRTSSLTTASGTGIGSVRSEVADALAIEDVPDSTLGREFSTEGGTLSGLLDGTGDQAKVTALWSGQACLFR